MATKDVDAVVRGDPSFRDSLRSSPYRAGYSFFKK